jgi:hypothetical protein
MRIIVSALLAVVLSASAVWAQATRLPSARRGPLGSEVTGFMQLGVGFTGTPVFIADSESRQSGIDIAESEVGANIPGYGVMIGLIPTWGMNGVAFHAGYETTSGNLKLNVDDGTVAEDADATFTVSDFILRTGYVRYFGLFDWHPYVLADAGLDWETMLLAADYENSNDEVQDSKIMGVLVGAGAGIIADVRGGVLGGEIRLDYHPAATRHDFPSPGGEYDLLVRRPLTVKIMLVLGIGRLFS